MTESSETAGEWGFKDYGNYGKIMEIGKDFFEGWKSWDWCEAVFHPIPDTCELPKITEQRGSLFRCGIQHLVSILKLNHNMKKEHK